MAIDVSVVIAFRDMGCDHRRRSFAYTQDWYVQRLITWAQDQDLGWRGDLWVEAGADEVSFTRASAINSGVRRSSGDVIVQTDPDTLVDARQLRKAVQLARERDGLVFPHNRYVRLGREATADFLAQRRTFEQMTVDDYEGPDGHGSGPDSPGGCVVFSRATWERAGGLDERFGLWGGDDAALLYAAEAFCGPTRRLPGDVTHLWHPRLPQSEIGSPGYLAQFAILAEYRDAAAVGPAAVRELVRSR